MTKREPFADSVYEKFFMKVEKTDTCWLWIGPCSNPIQVKTTDSTKPLRFEGPDREECDE